MEKNEIERLIRKYDIILNGDKIGTYMRGINANEFRSEVGPHKAEIIAYMREKEANAKKRHDTFESIPGLKEIRAAREDNAKWQREFRRMMDTGSSVMQPGCIHHSADEMASLECKYPQAVIALEIQYRATATENYEMSEIYNKAYDAICDGSDINDAKSAMDSELKAYRDRHFWD